MNLDDLQPVHDRSGGEPEEGIGLCLSGGGYRAMLFHLGAGPGGIASFCERYTASFNRWWDDLGVLHLDEVLAKKLSDGVAKDVGNETPADLSAKRDALIIAMQKAIVHLQRS